ncbi:hypothetical protein EZV73_26020 [Acidaminobacter sp. JC074]|uniref:HMA2 domain-containing protein n=1 Tax=Acidaminobacter sp. JC074 TaxID=2530199 RepID=UPI001F0F66FE|nr:hypothetical protein [Acidaminobacter sp. JC074]MCH4891062.1 hypothetical protein [Acidaminobacter sp. JC074]
MSIALGLLTGYAAIKAFRKEDRGSKSLTFGGEIEVVHAIKGRIRLRSSYLKNEEIVQGLLSQLTKISGIDLVKPSLITGSLLIDYDGDQIDQDLLVGALYRLIGIESNLEQMKKSKVLKEIQNVNDSVNYAMLDKTKGMIDLRTLLPLSFIGMAGYKIMTSGTITSPSAVTLLWWAYNSMQLGGKHEVN